MKNESFDKCFFSIILSTYNGSHFLVEQLQSIQRQSFINWEIIIIDDNSKDDTTEIIQRESSKFKNIKIFFNKENIGPTKSFMKALSYSKGRWIVFCDQDDIWMDNKLQLLYENIKANMSYYGFLHNGLYLTNSSQLGIDMKKVVNGEYIFKTKPDLSFLSLIKRNKVVGCMSAFNAKFIKEHINIKPPKFILHDYWIALIVSFYSKFKFVNQPLIKYRRHSNNYSLRNKNSFLKKLFQRFKLIFLLSLNHLYQIKK